MASQRFFDDSEQRIEVNGFPEQRADAVLAGLPLGVSAGLIV
jgi:hypothetical protein